MNAIRKLATVVLAALAPVFGLMAVFGAQNAAAVSDLGPFFTAVLDAPESVMTWEDIHYTMTEVIASPEPNARVWLIPGQGWNSPWFNQGSPIYSLYADNVDGVWTTGVDGTVIQRSDGFTWTLSMSSTVLIGPISTVFEGRYYTVTYGTVTETWEFILSSSFGGDARYDPWFEAAVSGPTTAVIEQAITYTITITNTGGGEGVADYAPLGAFCCMSASLYPGESGSFQYVLPGYHNPGLYTETGFIVWGDGYSQNFTYTVTVLESLAPSHKIFLPLVFRNFIPPTVIDRGTVTLTVGVGWTNPGGIFFGGEDYLAGLFALNDQYISISTQFADAQITCNGQNLTASDDDGNGIFDAGCSSSAPWVIQIRKDNIIELWRVEIVP